MLIGTFVGMMATQALTATAVRTKMITALFIPVSTGIGMVLGSSAVHNTPLMLTGFVLMMWAAIYVRRFGGSFFHYGALGWLGYFFAMLLRLEFSALPLVLLACVLSTVWVLLFSVTLLRRTPRWGLSGARNAFAARSRVVARMCVDLLAAGTSQQRASIRRRLHAQQLRLAETALLTEAWSAEPGALPRRRSATALRRWLLGLQASVEAMVEAVDVLAVTGTDKVKQTASAIAEVLSNQDHPAAIERADDLLRSWAADDPAAGSSDDSAAFEAARRLADAVKNYSSLVDRGPLETSRDDRSGSFRPAVPIAAGNLPGSLAAAHSVTALGRKWTPLRKAQVSTRQAVQVGVAGALAVLVGRAISEERYYWAAIAVFVAFTGTATRSESVVKATHRVVGTLTGMVVGLGLGHLTEGHITTELVVAVLCMTCGFYLAPLSHTYLIFFVTAMIVQVFSALNQFTPGLLVVRLEETVVGSVIAALVALIVLPTSTRDASRQSRTHFLSSIGRQLDAVAGHLDGSATDSELDAHSRALDRGLRNLVLVSAPLTSKLVPGRDAVLVRLEQYALAGRMSRALGNGKASVPETGAAVALATVASSLADAAHSLAQRRAKHTIPDTRRHLAEAATALAAAPADSSEALLLARLHRMLDGLCAVPAASAGRFSRRRLWRG
ncbi:MULTISPECIES: FUSC family protein [unclassified Streptomyces]|uniref:FUSC family protein n=1 Tax=unclassified Streptomyces TaxID=2593676 RepID=UPI003D9204D6